MKQELATQAGQLATTEPVSVESMLMTAIQNNISPESLEKLLELQVKVNAMRAKSAFDAALAAFQGEQGAIIKGRNGASTKGGTLMYKFAPLDKIVEEVSPKLRANGFSYTITSAVDKDWVTAICKVTHALGHSEVSEFKVPVEASPQMSAPQRYGSSLTFATRRAFCNAFGILTKDPDNDAQQPEKPRGAARVQTQPVAPQMTEEDIKWDLWVAIGRLAKQHIGDRTALRKWCIEARLVEPSEDVTPEKLSKEKLARIREAIEAEYQ